jgi:hypothetical protein
VLQDLDALSGFMGNHHFVILGKVDGIGHGDLLMIGKVLCLCQLFPGVLFEYFGWDG